LNNIFQRNKNEREAVCPKKSSTGHEMESEHDAHILRTAHENSMVEATG
jgi:hypothetical protein